MRYDPPFTFARRQDGRRVASQVVGDGELDLVFRFGWPTHLGLMWEDPSFAAFLRKLSSFSRLILYDRSGGGLSDRVQGGYLFEDEMDDVRAVMAAVGSERAALFGCHTGGRLALFDEATSFLEMVAPREANDASVRHWIRMFLVSSATFAQQYQGIRTLGPVDIRGLLGSVQVPVLLLHRTADRGTRRLKGVPDSWQLYAVELAGP